MATQTQTLQRNVIQQSRRHDHLYDPVYTLSGERDHARANMRAVADVSKIKRVPVYGSMFSELRHHPRYEIRLDTVDPVPKFISRQWRGDRSGAVLRLHAQGSSSVKYALVRGEDPQVTGVNRYKYFRRPLIPFNEPLGPSVMLAASRQDPLASGLSYGIDQQRSASPFLKVAQTQTDYRDSEAQTDPYSPEYVVQPGTQPELVSLALLSYGCGLPAGLAEVEMIERARAKRAWEATLPDLHDMDMMDKRRKMMEQQELSEWALREREIERIQEERLTVLMSLLKQREKQHEDLNSKHLDKLWSAKQENVQGNFERIRHEHARMLRKMVERKSKVEGKLERKSMVELYSDVGSQAYAPLTRVGVFRDRNSEQNAVKSKYLTSLNGLLELENSLPDFILKPVIKAPQRKTATQSGFLKRQYRDEKQLADIHKAIQDEKVRQNQPAKPLRFLQRVEKPVPRPPTPSVDVLSADEENLELAVIYLQQMIRGRALQNVMFEGKEKRIKLIRELRSTHALQSAEQQILKDEKQATLLLQRQQELYEHKENVIEEGVAALEGQSLGDTLDFLSKELIRLQEERRIHAFSILAERQRRIREAEESGQRQVEERRRREHDEIFKQVVKVHQNTVDAYLEDIIMSAIDATASDQARHEIQELAEQVNEAAYAAEKRRNTLMSEEIVSELVHGFLLPEVKKQEMREKVRLQQRKYLLAAHAEIFGNIGTLSPTQQHPESQSPTQQNVKSPSPTQQHPESQSPTQQNMKSPSSTQQHPESQSPTQQNVKSPSPTQQHPESQSPTQQNMKSPSSTQQHPESQSPTQQNVKSPSPTQQHPESQSPTQQNMKSPSSTQQHPKSQSPTQQNMKSPSSTQQHPESQSPTQQNVKSPSPTQQHPESQSPTQLNVKSPSPTQQDRGASDDADYHSKSPSPTQLQLKSPSPTYKHRESLSLIEQRQKSPIDNDDALLDGNLQLSSRHRSATVAAVIDGPRPQSAASEPGRDESRRSSGARPTSQTSIDRPESNASHRQHRPASAATITPRPESAAASRASTGRRGSKPATPSIADDVELHGGMRSPEVDSPRSSGRGGLDSGRVRSP